MEEEEVVSLSCWLVCEAATTLPPGLLQVFKEAGFPEGAWSATLSTYSVGPGPLAPVNVVSARCSL